MKAWIVYVDGIESRIIRAGSMNSAYKKAFKMYPGRHVQVVYTEV